MNATNSPAILEMIARQTTQNTNTSCTCHSFRTSTKVKHKGHFMLGELLADCAEEKKSHQRWVDHSLTIENLKIRKQLLKLKRAGTITKFMMRSGMFLSTHSNSQGIEKTLVVHELDQLNKMFPEVQQQEMNTKRSRPSGSTSPNTPTPENKMIRTKLIDNRRKNKPIEQLQRVQHNTRLSTKTTTDISKMSINSH